MSQVQFNIIFCSVSSLILVFIIYKISKRQLLSFRYTIGWLLFAGLGVTSGALIPMAQPISNLIKVTPTALLSIIAALILTMICIQLSVSISGLQRQIRRLTEEIALIQLEANLEDEREKPR